MSDETISSDIKVYLDEISERLGTGHAAIMVGAGFSKNAAPISGSKNTFPTWNDLGDLFYQKINGKAPGSGDKYLNPIKLAEEVNAVFGRPVLEQMLLANIADEDHKPTPLYNKLLELEWSDVFTTNYDTLLERAKDEITNRNYQVVLKKGDLINSKPPRIIKLHGSFPSHTPFIITEEDYRTYPKKFAPFVNTVQQSLLEKTLCLIGFSGDDPNFLQWIGWIRDHFEGDNSLKIYLIGILNLSEAQKKLLQKRNINIVELANLPAVNGDHAKAFEVLFDYFLSKKKAENKLEWPRSKHRFNSSATDKLMEIESLIGDWSSTRNDFPGWRIVPSNNRKSLIRYTNSGMSREVREALIKSPDFLDIKYLYELCWRLEKSLNPIWDNIAELVEQCIDKYWPFTKRETDNAISPSSIQYRGVDWKEIQQYWISLNLYILRYYREEGLHDKWKYCDKRLKNVLDSLSHEQRAALYYEQALSHLFVLDLSGLERHLDSWPTNNSLPFWEAKKAGLLAEIGQIEKAELILENSLTLIRKKQNLKPVSTDYSLVSDESYVMLLLSTVKQSVCLSIENDWSKVFDVKSEDSERRNILQQYRCEPWDELAKFNDQLEKEPTDKSRMPKQNFQLGIRTGKTIFLGGNDDEALAAYYFLRFCEDVGVAFRLPGVNVAANSAIGCLDRISSLSPHWALVTLLRISDKKATDKIFNRRAMSKFSPAYCDGLIELYLRKLKEAESDIKSETGLYAIKFGSSLAKILPEILSRLCCKCSDSSRELLLNFVLDIYLSDQKSRYEGIGKLVKMLFESMTEEYQYRSIPKLLSFPIPKDLDIRIKYEFPMPFRCLDIDIGYLEKVERIIIEHERIQYFINEAASKEEDIRKWAIATLMKLNDLKLLSEDEKISFSSSLWSQIGEDGFPINTGHHNFAWINIPSPDNLDIKLLLENDIRQLEIPTQSELKEKGVTLGGGLDHHNLFQNLIGANLNKIKFERDIYISVLDKVISWWQKDKHFLGNASDSVSEEFHARFLNICTVLSEFILPNLSINSQQNMNGLIIELINDLEASGIPTSAIKIAFIHIEPTIKEDAILTIEKAITSDNRSIIIDAVNAILNAVTNIDDEFSEVEKILLQNILVQTVIWQSKEGTISALNGLSRIVKNLEMKLVPELEQKVLLGLKITAQRTTVMNSTSLLSTEEQLDIRRSAAHLAFSIYFQYSKFEQEIPESVMEWKAICESELEFAEIRKQWHH